ncbi:MAG: lytic transglycosylase domain-containing protein, partial [Terriglobia bacterium]
MDALSLIAACSLIIQGTQHSPSCDGLRDPLRAYPTPIATQPAPRSGHSGVSQWRDFIAEAAQDFAIPESWIRAVMGQESGGHTTLHGRPITSTAGATGLMQVMPGTYADLRRRYSLGSDSYDPHDNILAGTAYLRQMYERYGYP